MRHNLYLQPGRRAARGEDNAATAGLIVAEARTEAERRAAYALRYRVFIEEMGGDGAGVDHAARIETDRFDAVARHLLLIDRAEGDRVVGTFRFMDRAAADRAGGFYTSGEYDLSALLASGVPLIECGRSCLDPGWRGGAGLFLLWRALARVVIDEGARMLFGVASFPGCDPAPHRDAIALLQHEHLAPPALCPVAHRPVFAPDALTPPAAADRLAVMRAMPALIKAYLRLGGVVGEGAFVDTEFNTTDVCMLLEVDRIPAESRARLLA